MTRTKRPVKRDEKAEDADDVHKIIMKTIAAQKNKIDNKVQMKIRDIDLAYKIFISSLNKTHLQMTLGEMKKELSQIEVPNTTKKTTRSSRTTASHDDGYLTENSSQGSGERGNQKFLRPPSTVGRKTTRRSRSADTSCYTTASKPQRRRSRSVYRTPAYSKNTVNRYPVITPKVAPHTPLTVLRQPRQGEMVLSMAGSPVMVPTCYAMQPDEKANCNILLQDGTMLSLQPKQLRKSQAYIPFSLMDTNVLHQLKTLKDNLNSVLELGEKAISK